MRQKIFIFASIFSVTLLFALCSLSFATKSRLSGMGELSIVIEDESNMINLWDFAHNPAGFLEDEKGSVIRGDFIWDTYQIRDIPDYDYQHVLPLSKYKADGDLSNNWVSLSFRKPDNFALGVEGNYLFRQTDSRYYKNERTYPQILFVFSQSVNSLTSFGANLRYIEQDLKLTYKTYPFVDQRKLKNFQAQMGMERELLSGVTLGTHLGYDWLSKPEEGDYYYLQPGDVLPKKSSTSYAFWLSGQTVVEIEPKLKLGLETIFKFKRADFRIDLYNETGKHKKENYYFSFLKLRGMYNFSSKFRLGLFYFDNELFAGFYEPIYSVFFLPPYEVYVRHWGMGFSYKFKKNTLIGVEYHFRDFSRPSEDNRIWGLKSESLNLGVEGKLSEALSLRGGYIRTETNQNPNYDKQRDAWESALTLGFGYEPYQWNLIFEFSYRYAFKKFKQFFGDPNPESGRHVFSLSLKKVL